MINLQVLYEDNHLIAVFKPAGILAQPDTTKDASMFDEVKKYLKEKYKKPGNVFLGLLHRLDRPVSGIMLFAKTSKGASRLSEQFRNRTIEKTYHAVVCGRLSLPQKGALKNFLGKDTKTMKAREFTDGQEVKLYYEIVKSSGRYYLLKIRIDTGKFHQIRVQLSAVGCPIIGDVKYGGETWHDEKSIALCATEFSFYPATSNERVKLSIETPVTWNKYLSTE